ncbi:hypothetical protein D3C83_108770 [compost metagenome]
MSDTSIVIIIITEVTKKNSRPIAVSRPAFCVNAVICSTMVSMPASGRKFSSRNSCSWPMVSSNTGKAVDTASATVSSGTSESRVV